MFGYYSAPSHFNQYHHSPYLSTRPSYYYSPSSSSASCSQQYHRVPRHYYVEDNDDDEENSSATYYEYLDAARRQQERRELLEAQAHRRAQEERAIQQARARAHAEKLEAQRRSEQIRQEREYRGYVERQLETRRQAQLRAQQLQRQQELEQEQELERQRKIHIHQHRQQRRSQQFTEEDFARALFGQLGWQPLTQHAKERSASPSAPVKPVVQPASSSQEPAVKPLPASAQSQTQHRQQPRMSYMAAVTLIRSLAKEQISIRRRLRDLHRISSEFSALKSSFVFPEALVFDLEKSTTESPALAYTPRNLPLRAQEESLTRLLTKLDAVPSNGSERIKSQRKSLAKGIQAELVRLDKEKIQQWKKQSASNSDESIVLETASASSQEDVPMSEQQHEEMQEAVPSPVDEKVTEQEVVDSAMAAEHTDEALAGKEIPSVSSPTSTEPLVQMEIDQSPVPLPAAAAEGEVQHIQVSGPTTVSLDSITEPPPPEQPSLASEPFEASAATTSDNSDMTAQAYKNATDRIDLPETAISSAPKQQEPSQPSSPAQTELQAEVDPKSQESTSSVSATLLPATHGLGLLDVISPPVQIDEADAESDSGSDTSFEML